MNVNCSTYSDPPLEFMYPLDDSIPMKCEHVELLRDGREVENGERFVYNKPRLLGRGIEAYIS